MRDRRTSPALAFQVKVLPFWLALTFFSWSRVEAQKSEPGETLELKLSTGYSVENLRWSIAGKNTNGDIVNILSELKWNKPAGIYLNLQGEWNTWKGIFVRAALSKTFFSTGMVTDTDFNKNHRRDTLFHDTFSSNRGGVICYRTAIGYKIHFLKKHTIAPFAGYGNDSQLLYLLRDNGNVLGDLKSTYKTKWNGFFAGFDLRLSLYKKLIVRGQLTYHQVNYSADADWNLIKDFKHPLSFQHKAKGYGLTTEAGIGYPISKKLVVMFNMQYGYWTTGKGTDTLYRSDGDISITPLNGVQRNNYIFSGGLQLTM